MDPASFQAWLLSSLLLSLRLAPALAFAPPFSLTRVPPAVRVLLSLAVAGCLAAASPDAARLDDYGAGALVLTAARELALGIVIALGLQVPFAALQLCGRTIDVQAGFGLAAVIDPVTRARNPLTGTLFVYGAGAVFFSLNGHHDLLRILGVTLELIPLGRGEGLTSLAPLSAFVSASFLMGFGVGGMVILSLFLVDLTIAALSRTMPQMNVLVLGFQVKTLVLLTTLPVAIGAAGALLARLMAYALNTLPMLL